MNALNLAAVGLPVTITILVCIGFYKVFIKKVSIQAFYTPYDKAVGQSVVEFHEEQKVIIVDEENGDDKEKHQNS